MCFKKKNNLVLQDKFTYFCKKIKSASYDYPLAKSVLKIDNKKRPLQFSFFI